jgi:hypothetical protein
MNVEERKRRDQASVRELRDLLQRIASTPTEYLNDDLVKSMLRRQGAMAKFSRAELSINAMSLNHQKRVAAAALGSYESLNILRKHALRSLERHAKAIQSPMGAGKSDLKAKIERLEGELRVLREDMFALQRAYDLRCIQARSYAMQAGAMVLAICDKEFRELEHGLDSLARRSSDG